MADDTPRCRKCNLPLSGQEIAAYVDSCEDCYVGSPLDGFYDRPDPVAVPRVDDRYHRKLKSDNES